MRWTQVLVGVVMLIAGTVWIVQGAGALHGSFMTGSPVWLWIGIATAATGLVLCARGVSSGRGSHTSGPPRVASLWDAIPPLDGRMPR